MILMPIVLSVEVIITKNMCMCEQAIRATIPYIRSDVPILIIFRALGLTADKDILQHVVYDFNDTGMMEALRPSIEEAFPIQTQEVDMSSAHMAFTSHCIAPGAIM